MSIVFGRNGKIIFHILRKIQILLSKFPRTFSSVQTHTLPYEELHIWNLSKLDVMHLVLLLENTLNA